MFMFVSYSKKDQINGVCQTKKKVPKCSFLSLNTTKARNLYCGFLINGNKNSLVQVPILPTSNSRKFYLL